jgi:hypothetical protein
MNDVVVKVDSCRGCGSPLKAPFLKLGDTPLANSYLNLVDEIEEVYPLSVCFCSSCYLVQLSHTISPKTLFSDYAYFSSFSTTFLEHAKEQAEYLVNTLGADSNSKVLELASNDGYFLKYLKPYHIKTLGIEPATNIANVAHTEGIPTINAFFGTELVPQILSEFGKADFIIGNNVLAHVPNVNDFLKAVSLCLTNQGIAAFEFPYLLMMLNKTEFDTIYHEHVFYYSVIALKNLFHRAGLEIFDIKFSSIHGGSIQVFVQHKGGGTVRSIVSFYELQERSAMLDYESTYERFADQIQKVKDQLLYLVNDIVITQGLPLAAYGAPAKGNTLLNYCKISSKEISFTVDISPYKQGKFLPGSRIPIKEPSELLQRKPNYTLILPWNFADEIRSQQKVYEQEGGQFIVPVPIPRIL